MILYSTIRLKKCPKLLMHYPSQDNEGIAGIDILRDGSIIIEMRDCVSLDCITLTIVKSYLHNSCVRDSHIQCWCL